jgi:uncharacterized repeat protein (TIGR03806 family)
MNTGRSSEVSVVRVLVILCCFVLSALHGRAADSEKPFGLETRVPWENSRLVGSPEPPLPYSIEKVFTNVTWRAPIYIADEPGTDDLMVVLAGGESERPSRILRVKDDVAASATDLFFELPRRLIYSLCFHPGYTTNRQVYLFSNGPTSSSPRTNRVSRFAVTGKVPRIDADSERTIIEWSSSGHDGGDMAFGLDGMLYVTTGDGSTDSDTLNSGQTMDDLLAAVLRIDVDRPASSQPYRVPSDNPFVNMAGARPEIWAYGFRNPWRMCIDRESGRVWVGNNGQDLWETAHLVRRGENYGWSVYEGSHPFYPGRKSGPTPHVAPTIEHSHGEFRSLTGGVVYDGRRFPELDGVYVYGDYGTGRIWGMKHNGRRALWHRELADTALQIAAFRVDQRGDLLIVDHGGGIYRLVPALRPKSLPRFPARLSDTGLFASVKDHRVAPGLIPYSVKAAGWADGAEAERFMAVPGTAKVKFDPARGWEFPDGSALVQTLSLEREAGNPASRARIETRVLLRQQGEWAGYSYRWKANQSDALLVPKEGAEETFSISQATRGRGAEKAEGQRAWRFPSRSECMVCHSRQANFVLGIIGEQLNGEHLYGAVADNQLRALEHIGLFSGSVTKGAKDLDRMVNPYDRSANLETRVRSYLHVNCAPCHVEAGGGNARMELEITRKRERLNLIGARPQHGTFGLENAMVVAPGAPDRSVLLYRVSRRGPGQMPPLVSHRVDEGAVQMFREWIAQLKPEKPEVHEWRVSELLPKLPMTASGRSFAAGQTAFRETGCNQCHRFAGTGGAVGPDLAGVGHRLPARELLESILEPSKLIADDYATHDFELLDGETVSGRIEREDGRRVVLRPVASESAATEIEKKKIRRRQRSALSPMPAGMVNTLTEEQVLDLLAYLISDGDAGHPCFK